MDFRLLGPLEVAGDGGRVLPIGTGRQRALLALLILRANELVSSDRLVEELWGEDPPATAHKMLHNQVSGLRRVLGRNGRLETHGSAYRLNVNPGERDLDRFEELLASGRDQLASDPGAAAEKLRQALSLWHGAPLSDLAYEHFAQAEIARLEERRWAAFEARAEAELALGRHADLVSELEAAVAEQPLREHLHGQLMLALYRCGRQADALEAYRSARRTLVEEIGLEPGAELRALQDAILVQDPALAAPAEGLPAPLDGGSPLLAGRDRELSELKALLADACEGRAAVVLVSGPRGIGKTRLAAELAREALSRRAAVFYADGLGAIRRAEECERPALLVLDDADTAEAELVERAADLAALKGRRLLLLVLSESPQSPAALATHAARSLELGPLGEEAIAAIGRLYLPAAGATPPPQALAAESSGVPLAAHRAAAEWARAQAALVAEASAGRTAAERFELRAAEADLSGDLLALRAVDERDRLYGGESHLPLPAVCPFLGLATFDAAHAEYFFGRERLVAEMVARLVGSPLLAVVGPSGAGKSSAVRAGLLPALASGVLPGSGDWHQALMRPGAHPLAELERVLPGGPGKAVVTVDQFEESFTLCRDERERTEFLDALVALAAERDRRVQVVIAVRADFYGRCASHDGLARLVGANQVLVGPMRPDELHRAIVEPARRVGLRVEPSLTDALIADVLDEPGGLPLLSAALLEQWRERDGHVMRRAAYERTGGVRSAVGRLAEATYTGLSGDERVAARRILLRLADAGENHESAFVRRRVPLAELETGSDEHAAAALSALTDSRLLTAHEGTVEVAHEALLREWPRLRAWLEEDAQGRRLHQHLIHAARDWDAAERDPGELYRGARLASAVEWAGDHRGDLNALEREFLDASRAEAEHEADHQRRTNRRLRVLLLGLAALLGLALVAGIVALNQRGEARDAARIADAQRLGVEALGEERLDQALLRTRTAVELDESSATLGNMLSVLLRNPAAVGVLDYGWVMYGAALSPDGRLMAVGDERGSVVIYDAASRRPVAPPYRIQSGLIQNVRFSPDGGTLAVSYMDLVDPVHPKFDLIDARTARRTLHVQLPVLSQPAGFIYTDVVFPPDERELLARPVSSSYPDAPAAPMYRVNRQTGDLAGRLRVGRFASSFYGSKTADRRSLFITSLRDDKTWQLATDTLRVVRSWPVGGFAGAVSPDGTAVVLTTMSGELRLLDLASGDVRPFSGRHDDAINRIEFTPDGRRLVTADAGGQLFVWDVARGTIAQRLAGHARGIDGLDISNDGRTLLTASQDTRAILWDLAGDRRLDRRFFVGRPFAVNHTPRGIAVSPDGRTLALTHSDGVVDLLDARTLRRRASVRALDGHAASVAFSPDSRLLAVTGEDGELTLWNARTLAPAGELEGMKGISQALAFSPDGEELAAVEAATSADAVSAAPQPLRVWHLRSGAPTGFRAQSTANLLAYSPDGELLAAAATERGTEIRHASTGKLIERLVAEGESRSVAFSPDGELLFVGQYDGAGRLFSTRTWRPVGQALKGAHTARITFPAFTPDGRTLVTAAADGTVVLWDVDTQTQIGAPLRLAPNTFASAALSPDGSRLYAISTRGEGISFNMSPEAWKRHACLVAGRELTPAEWKAALPERPYETVCSGD